MNKDDFNEDNMKIAILTLPLHINYGGIIQNYALQTALQQMGYEVETINLKKILLAKKYDIPCLRGLIDSLKSGARQKVDDFIHKNIVLTDPIYNKKDLLNYDFSRFDAIVVGSDQVWRVRYAYPDLETYFLDFIKTGSGCKRMKKIAFSASFGIDSAEYSEEQKDRCGELIKDFDLVTVREESALPLINDVYRWECKKAPMQTLDPTLLLSKEDYIKVSASCHHDENTGGLFYYVLDMTEEKWNLIQRIAQELNVKPFTVRRKPYKWYDRDKGNKLVSSPGEWLQSFHQAAYVFTDSFHGVVFSLIFQKQFVAFGNKKRGMSRFHSLLDKFHLKNRLISSAQDYDGSLYAENIKWDEIRLILEEDRKKVEDAFASVLSSGS